MRVGVDMISPGLGFDESVGGMVVYYDALLTELAQLSPDDDVVAFVSPWRPFLGVPEGVGIRTHVCRGLPRSRLLRVLYEQLVFPRVLARARVDVLLSTCNTTPLGWRGPAVVVLQNIQWALFPEQFQRRRLAYLRRAVPASLRKADVVIAVSEWERAEAIRLFGLDSSRVVAVHHGVSRAVCEGAYADAPSVEPSEDPYVLTVSSLYEHKNHRRLIQAFARVARDHGLSHRLLVAGGDGDVTSAELARVAEAAGIGDRVSFLGPVPHSEVGPLLAGADAVAYVSICETFGFPVLEALAHGRPLVTANRTAMPEVAGGAALLVDPFDVEDIARGLTAALLDEEVRACLRTAGPRRVADFSWRRCAEQTRSALADAFRRRAAETTT